MKILVINIILANDSISNVSSVSYLLCIIFSDRCMLYFTVNLITLFMVVFVNKSRDW